MTMTRAFFSARQHEPRRFMSALEWPPMVFRRTAELLFLVSCLLAAGVACSSSGSKPDGADGPLMSSDSGEAPAPDAGSDAGSDGVGSCPSFASNTKDCSDTCLANCYGTNASHVSDPSVLIGDCYFTGPANIRFYCTPVGIADPCSHCR
jgi:hypothetical protein